MELFEASAGDATLKDAVVLLGIDIEGLVIWRMGQGREGLEGELWLWGVDEEGLVWF